MTLIELNNKYTSEPSFFNDYKHARELVREQYNLKGIDSITKWNNLSAQEKTIVVDWFVLPKTERIGKFLQIYKDSSLWGVKYLKFGQDNSMCRDARYKKANNIIGAFIHPTSAVNIALAVEQFRYETNYVMYGLESFEEDGVHGQIHDWLNGEGVFGPGQVYENKALNNITITVYSDFNDIYTVNDIKNMIKNQIINGA